MTLRQLPSLNAPVGDDETKLMENLRTKIQLYGEKERPGPILCQGDEPTDSLEHR